MNKHLKLFANHSAYSQAESNLDKPNVAVCQQEGDVHYNPYVDPYNGHAYVDLGLPSGTKWATMNVGASSETDYGNYYMYGMGSKTYDSTDTPYAGTENPLDLSKDTAAQTWGGGWHMPTDTQFRELLNSSNCTKTWTVIDGIAGYQFISVKNNNTLFLPATGIWRDGSKDAVGEYGYYWSSSPLRTWAMNLNFSNNYASTTNVLRTSGASIRPVVG